MFGKLLEQVEAGLDRHKFAEYSIQSYNFEQVTKE
jgi:hypothetical protein